MDNLYKKIMQNQEAKTWIVYSFLLLIVTLILFREYNVGNEKIGSWFEKKHIVFKIGYTLNQIVKARNNIE